jgi:hypothetical protein
MPVGLRVLPDTVTIEIDQRVRFRGELHTSTGRVYVASLSWEASGGSIDSAGHFSAARPGTYHVVARSRAIQGERGRWETVRQLPRQVPDTSVVIVVPSQPELADIRVSPRNAKVDAGATHVFTAVGILADGSRAPIGVLWSATGGTIDPSGMYQAGAVPGAYQVVASNTLGTVADTVTVRVRPPVVPDSTVTPVPDPDSTPDPTPEPDPEPTLARVVLRPASVLLAVQTTHQFSVFGRTESGDSVAVDVTFQATGGTITSTGLYTAGSTAGTYRVVASTSGLADTAVVSLTPPVSAGGSVGIPFGPFGVYAGTSFKSNTDMFSSGANNVTPENLITRLNVARSRGMKILIQMTGGHEPYLTDGVFDMAKWKATMDRWNTPTLKQAVAAAVADGTIIGNSVMDEPHVSGMGDGNTWGPKGTMTKARVDTLCGYVKAIFPTMPVGVVHQHHIFEPAKTYRVCEFIVSQYTSRFGSVTAFRDSALAYGRRDGIAIAFSMNILNGGIQAPRDGLWNCPLTTTGGRGTFDPNCRMTAQQVRDWGLILAEAGCALFMWRYDDAFMARSDNQQAFRDIAARVAALPARSCRTPVT